MKLYAMKIFVHAKTHAKAESIHQIDAQHFEVRVKESPVDGKANRAIETLMAEYYKIPKAHVKIASGFSSKHKVLLVR